MKARVISTEMLVPHVAKRWVEQYANTRHTDKIEIGRRLLALDKPTAETIASIIGNDSWCSVRCDGCGWYGYGYVIQVGEAPYYESNTANLCQNCLNEAVAIGRQVKNCEAP